MGRLVGEASARAGHLTRAGLKDGLERVKQLPATSGVDGTTMGFGNFDHAALKGRYLVLREWRDGKTVQVT
jgi:branched-chain amino acid transport system substrate-binding protein